MSDKKTVKIINKSGPFGGAYFLAFIGAAVYFVQRVDGFWSIILALMKACVWPAFVVHALLRVLNV